MMKICMLAYAHYLNDARIKSYVRTLEDRGHQVDVVALRSDGEFEVEPQRSGTIYRLMEKYQGGRKIMYAWSYCEFFLRALLFFVNRSFSGRYDVIHVHNMPNVLVYAAIIPKLLGVRVMLDVHDLMPVNYMAKFGVSETSLPVMILRWEQRLSALMADWVFCADHNQRDYLVEYCSVPASKVIVLLNLPNTDMFKRVDVLKSKDAFRIVYHGTIAHRLGIDLIVRAFGKVIATGVPAELWVYGAGDFLSDSRALVAELGLDGKAHFSGTFFPVEKIPEMVCGMDIGIIGNRSNLACSRYMLPVKLLEYVYLGLPVVVPRLEVIQHYFSESMVCFYDPENVDQMADAILTLYRNPELREQTASEAQRFYKKYNIEAQARQYLELMEDSNRSQNRVAQV